MKGLIVYLLDHRNEFNLWRGVSDVFLCPGQRWGKEKRNKSIFRLTSRMVVFPDSRAQVRRVLSSLKREVYHLTEAPNGGHIQHPSSHLGEELLKLYLYFPSPLLPPEQAYPEGYDEKGGTEKHSVV